MPFRVRHVAAVLLLLGAGAETGNATEPRTWYVYCEGANGDRHAAVFSENFWPHPETAGYARLVGRAAKAFFESRHDLALDGCAGVNFRDHLLAEHSRSLTVQLHRRMGDRIYFLLLPPEILPVAPQSASLPASPVASTTRADGHAAAASAAASGTATGQGARASLPLPN